MTLQVYQVCITQTLVIEDHSKAIYPVQLYYMSVARLAIVFPFFVSEPFDARHLLSTD
jgi:hypothetical protein